MANLKGSKTEKNLKDAFAGARLDGTVTVHGSLLHLHFETTSAIRSYRDTNPQSRLLAGFHGAALREGVSFSPEGLLSISTPMTEDVIDELGERLSRAARRVGHG